MKKERPVFLNLTQYRFPRMAIVSILHRISGVVLFLAIPYLLYVLQTTLASQESFDAITQTLSEPLSKLILSAILAAVLFHWVAGVRHLMMDLGYAESLRAGKVTATLVFVVVAILVGLAGAWLWL